MDNFLEEILKKDEVVSNDEYISLYDLYYNGLKDFLELSSLFKHSDNYIISDNLSSLIYNKSLRIDNVMYNCNSNIMLIRINFIFYNKYKFTIDFTKKFNSDEINYESNDLFFLKIINTFIDDNSLILDNNFTKLEKFYNKYKYDVVNNHIISSHLSYVYEDSLFLVKFFCGTNSLEILSKNNNEVIKDITYYEMILKRLKLCFNELSPFYQKIALLSSINNHKLDVIDEKSFLEYFQWRLKEFLKCDVIISNNKIISLYDLRNNLMDLEIWIRENLFFDSYLLIDKREKINTNIHKDKKNSSIIIYKINFNQELDCIEVNLKYFIKNSEYIIILKKCIDDGAIFTDSINDNCKNIIINNIDFIEKLFNILTNLYNDYGGALFKETNLSFKNKTDIFNTNINFKTIISSVNHSRCNFEINFDFGNLENYVDKLNSCILEKYLNVYSDEIIKRIGVKIDELDSFYEKVAIKKRIVPKKKK